MELYMTSEIKMDKHVEYTDDTRYRVIQSWLINNHFCQYCFATFLLPTKNDFGNIRSFLEGLLSN